MTAAIYADEDVNNLSKVFVLGRMETHGLGLIDAERNVLHLSSHLFAFRGGVCRQAHSLQLFVKLINEVVLIKVWSSDFIYRNPEGFIVINWTILANTRNNFEVSRLSEFEYVVIGGLSIRYFRIMKDVKGKEFINEFSRALFSS